MARSFYYLIVAIVVPASLAGCKMQASEVGDATKDPSLAQVNKAEEAAAPSSVSAETELPKVDIPGWEQVFRKHPELFDKGVHLVESPEKAFVIVGGVPLASVRLKTARDREIARQLAELAAKRALLLYCFSRDKQNLRFPPHWQNFADDALQCSAYQQTITVLGMQYAAGWSDTKTLWCMCIVAQGNVAVAKDFERHLSRAGCDSSLDDFFKTQSVQSLYRAFEFDPESQKVRGELAKEFLARGQRIAAYLLQQDGAQLPTADDSLARFLAGTDDPAWREGLKLFQAQTPDLDQALAAFLHALDTRYADPDALNYVGVCCRKLGYPRLACLFLAQSLEQSPRHIHRYALTNMGLCFLDAGSVQEGRAYLEKAVAEFPEESWTEHARKAIADLDKAQPPLKKREEEQASRNEAETTTNPDVSPPAEAESLLRDQTPGSDASKSEEDLHSGP